LLIPANNGSRQSQYRCGRIFHSQLRPTKDARRSSEPEHPATSSNGDVFFQFWLRNHYLKVPQ
jgi:hypothetical protein